MMKPIISSTRTAKKIVQATVALQNFIMLHGRNLATANRPYSSYTERDETTISEGFRPVVPRNRSPSDAQEAKLIRDKFCHYFNNTGTVPWSWDRALNNDL